MTFLIGLIVPVNSDDVQIRLNSSSASITF